MTKYNKLLVFWLLVPLASPAAAEDFAAVLQWAQSVELSTPVSGVVQTVAVSAGQTVDSDTVLVKLEDTVFKARLDAAKAAFQLHSRLHEEAQKELEREQEMFDATMLSEHELETARINADRANAEYQAAKAAMAQAEYNWRHSEVRAPFDAIVLKVLAVPGKTVASNLRPEPLVTVALRDKMHVYAEVGRSIAAKLQPGQKVVVKFAGKSFNGKLAHNVLEPVGDGKYPVYVEFSPGKGKAIAGQKAILVLP